MGSWNSFAAVPDIADRGVAVSHLLKQGTEGAVAPVTRSLPGPPHGEPAAKQLYSTASADALTSSPMLSVFYGGGLPAPALSAPGQLADHPAAADESAHLTDVSGPQHRHSPAAHHNGGAGFSVRTDFSRPAHPGQGGFADFCAASAQCHAVSDASYAALRQAELLLARPRQQDAGDVSTDSGGLTIESGDGRGAAGHDAAQLQSDGDSPNASANGASPFDRAQVTQQQQQQQQQTNDSSAAETTAEQWPTADQQQSTPLPGSSRRKGRHPSSAAEPGPGSVAAQQEAEAAERQQQRERQRSQARVRARRRGAVQGKRRRGRRSGPYVDLIGKDVDIPASIFDIQVPDLFYHAKVVRRDPSHAAAVVIRFPEDGSTFWLPAAEVWRYVREGEARRSGGKEGLVGEAAEEFAAEVLVSLSTASRTAASTATASASDGAHPSGEVGDDGNDMARPYTTPADGADTSTKRRSGGEATSVLAAAPFSRQRSHKRRK